MTFYLLDDAKRIAKRLKRIAEDGFIADARLKWFQKAVAEGLGFRHFHDMLISLPGEAT